MRVLVTGGAGYIGSVITDQLVAGGHRVVVYDNLSKGHQDAVNDEATFVEGDLLDAAAVKDALVNHDIEAVVHMAAASLVGESMISPGLYYQNNVVATVTLLNALVETKIKMLVFSSTAAVYGEPSRVPIFEDDATAPSNTYGETKLAVERALHWYHAAHAIRYASLRYFNAAGATDRRGERHDPETHLIPLVLRAASDDRLSITVFGRDYPTRDGTCVRDYIHVSDLADAHVRALEALAAKELREEIFNLGVGDGFTVQEVINTARKVTGREIGVVDGPRRAGDPAALVASSARISKALGWRPQHSSLEEIIASAWKWETTVSPRGDAEPNTRRKISATGAAAR
jgi:UDP-glucose 4-epimerase